MGGVSARSLNHNILWRPLNAQKQNWLAFRHLGIYCFCCVKGSNRNEIGFFPRHTLPDLLDYAGEVLNGWDLSPTQKQQYGLAD